jgi:hypothetical protein
MNSQSRSYTKVIARKAVTRRNVRRLCCYGNVITMKASAIAVKLMKSGLAIDEKTVSRR